jgi:hypothetical protein
MAGSLLGVGEGGRLPSVCAAMSSVDKFISLTMKTISCSRDREGFTGKFYTSDQRPRSNEPRKTREISLAF